MNLAEYTLYNPYFSMTVGLDEIKSKELSDRLTKLPEESRDLLTSEELAGILQTLIESGTILPKYRVALAKIVGFVALGDVKSESVPGLLMKLGIPEENSNRAAHLLRDIFWTLETFQNLDIPLEQVHMDERELPPLTTQIPPKSEVPASPQVPARNIIDLRKEQSPHA